MILVDTSVWIDHLRHEDAALSERLDEGEILTHSFVIGELACRNIRNRTQVLDLMNALPTSQEALHHEVMELIERKLLMGRGIGYVDAHLLAAALLTPYTQLWTRDRRLQQVATSLGVGAALD